MPDSALPPHLRGKMHWDWPTIAIPLPRGKRLVLLDLKKIPRGWTAFDWGAPRLLLGNVPKTDRVYGAPKPITSPGTWQLSYYPYAPWWAKVSGLAFYAAASGKRGADGKFRHVRAGTRWDDVDDYATIFAVATRKFTGGDDQDTSTR
jgi:hypothetical protein